MALPVGRRQEMAGWRVDRQRRVDVCSSWSDASQHAGPCFALSCKMSVDMMGLEADDMIDEIEDVINVGTFVEMAADAQIIFV